MKRSRLLLVVPDADAAASLRVALAEHGFEVHLAGCAEEAILAAPGFAPDVVLAEVDELADGPLLLRGLAEQGSDAAVVVAAAADRLAAAVEALRAGAESYLLRPIDRRAAAVLLDKALEARRLRGEAARLRDELRRRHVMVGSSPELQLVQEVIRRAAPTKAAVLVLGESGTGRELTAQVVHASSPRRDRPLVRVSCAARSEALLASELFGHEPGAVTDDPGRRDGAFLRANGGTVFLHEVAHLAPALQIRLLRVLQHGELERVGGRDTVRTDVRVVASSASDLAAEVQAGRFRDDLYYRLDVVAVTLPPLRERKGDVPALAEHFLARSAERRGKDVRALSPGVLSALFAYGWPGNVRELAAVIDLAVAACSGREIRPEHLSLTLHERAAPGATLFEIERDAILRTLEEVGGSAARAAELLGVSARKIQYRVKEYRGGHPAPRREGAGVLPFRSHG